MRSRSAGRLVVLALLALAGCAHYRRNDPLTASSARPGYVFDPQPTATNTNSLFVCLAFSGGGTRAAAFSYGVLDKLRNTRIVWKGQEKRLLDEVDCISSISGGSFTAAYYGLFGDRIFDDFRRRFLDRDVQGALAARAASPLNWPKLLSPNYDRIDLAADYYDAEIFDHATFAALAGRRRPYVILNGTNLANGERFEFTQPEFDVLGSDLATYPVARAVAASSAFPFLLSPLSLVNYPASDAVKVTEDMREAGADFQTNRRRWQWAKNRVAYTDVARRPYVHLMDGGLADNVGTRPIEAAYRRSSGFIRKLINDGEIEKLVIIVVNARTDTQDEISTCEHGPGLSTVGYKTATIALDNYSFESIETMKDLRDGRRQVQDMMTACQKKLDACPRAPKLPRLATDVQPYVVDVDFDAIPDADRRAYFLGLPTSFSLQPEQVQKLVDAGGEILAADPEYQHFLQSVAP